MDNNPPAGGELDPLYRAVFDDPQNGTPYNITQAGCLSLARLGKEAWNAWRQKYPARYIRGEWKNTADFSGFDFRTETIDFNGFVFDHGACFDGVKFGGGACFKGAQFGNYPSFTCAQFGDDAQFSDVKLGDHANFTGAQFGDHASFSGAKFGDSAIFESAQFGDYASFDGTQFGEFAYFFSAQFGDGVSFAALTWAALTYRYRERPGGLDAAKTWAEERGLSPESFKSIFFEGVEFAGQVNFSGRAFEGPTSFGRFVVPVKLEDLSLDYKTLFLIKRFLSKRQLVVFGKAPLFHNCKLHQDTLPDIPHPCYPELAYKRT